MTRAIFEWYKRYRLLKLNKPHRGKVKGRVNILVPVSFFKVSVMRNLTVNNFTFVRGRKSCRVNTEQVRAKTLT